MCLETILHLLKIKYISSYQGFKGLQYVDLQLDLERIKTCKGSKNYLDLQLDLQRIIHNLKSGKIFFQII